MRNALPPVLASATLLGLAACTTTPPPAPPVAGNSQCVAEPGAWAVGKPLDDALVQKIKADTHSRDARVLRPLQPATLDYRVDRVNILLDDHDKVSRITCG